jgi:hypothetical protein
MHAPLTACMMQTLGRPPFGSRGEQRETCVPGQGLIGLARPNGERVSCPRTCHDGVRVYIVCVAVRACAILRFE